MRAQFTNPIFFPRPLWFLFSDIIIFLLIYFHELGLCSMYYLVIAFMYVGLCSMYLVLCSKSLAFWLLNFFLHQFRIAKIIQCTCVTSIGTRVFFFILWHRTFGKKFLKKENLKWIYTRKKKFPKNSQIFVKKMTRFVRKKIIGDIKFVGHMNF
jgi:hypothetical protein